MLQTPRAMRGMVVAPHHLASQAGLRVLQEGGNAIEAMIAAASTITVVYPHMNSLGGDSFWLISDGGTPLGIDACGAVAAGVDAAFYRSRGYDAIPSRGPLAANTVAGAVSGWQAALELSARWGGRLPLARLLEDAIHYAREGSPVSNSQYQNTVTKLDELSAAPGFVDTFLLDGEPPPVGSIFKNSVLATTLEGLAEAGLEDFYRGALAELLAISLQSAGSPLGRGDLAEHSAQMLDPLVLGLTSGTLYNMPPPTQGLASLIILGIFERLGCAEAEDFAFVHGMVEATKCAFRVRDAHVTDPAYMTVDPASFLTDEALSRCAESIDARRAMPSTPAPAPGDTVWLGAVDGAGRAVSCIQSLYWEFGSGVVLDDTGIVWQNRGSYLSLDEHDVNLITPRRKPFHTIHPAMARLADGRLLVYGTMGGEGQPQTQAALYARYVLYGQELQSAVTAPRWLYGRTWGAATSGLRIEDRFAPGVIDALVEAGHEVETVAPFTEIMGHAGAIVRHPDGLLEGAVDPRGDGVVAAF